MGIRLGEGATLDLDSEELDEPAELVVIGLQGSGLCRLDRAEHREHLLLLLVHVRAESTLELLPVFGDVGPVSVAKGGEERGVEHLEPLVTVTNERRCSISSNERRAR